jgi:hypothetical protein
MKPLRYVQHNSRLDVNLDDLAFVLKSRDRAMNTTLIAEDLLRSFLGNGGSLYNGTRVLSVEKGRIAVQRIVSGEAVEYTARHIILATGKESPAFETGARVFISPLLVVAPALTDLNFVRMSPHMRDTINHVYHRHGEVDYSVIGNAIYYDAKQMSSALEVDVRQHMMKLSRNVLGSFENHRARLLFGAKTEVGGTRSMRNYLYKIIDRGDYTLTLPGKFSLCFSLAANVCRHFGIEPVERLHVSSQDVSDLVERPKHLRLAGEITGLQTPSVPTSYAPLPLAANQ